MKQYLSLREQYPRLTYRRYETEENDSCLKTTHRFETLGLSEFTPVWVFPKTEGDCHRWSEDRLMRDVIFSLGMVELVGYWKIICPPIVTVEAGWLNQDQIDWWKDLYFSGLGEFFYASGIKGADPNHFTDIRYASQHETQYTCQPKDPCTNQHKERHEECGVEIGRKGNGVLIPIGGEKDSAVALELLRLTERPVCVYITNPGGATIHTTEVAGLDAAHVISAKRALDSSMLELDRQGYLNGHTLFSALVAFPGIIATRMHGPIMVALSNESSVNESMVQGSTVNHQYSKSFKFEEDFHYYQTTYLRGSAYYFSMLHPLSEFQIVRFFAGQKQYHGISRSCSAGSKADSWCEYCPKCSLVYLTLSLFLKPQEVRGISDRNMLDDWDMKETLDQLIGIEEKKLFECVGSYDEINAAIVLTIKGLEDTGEALLYLLSYYKATDLYQIYRTRGDQYSSYYDGNNLVPDELAELVRKRCTDNLQGEQT